jgi:hypothetical protein
MRRWFWVLDAIVVVSFVAVGRDSHGFTSDWGETLRIAAPFLIGLVVANVVTLAWRSPLALLTGLNLGAATLIVGMLLRRFVWDDGAAVAFVIVTGAWLVGWMIGWRLAVLCVRRYLGRSRVSDPEICGG